MNAGQEQFLRDELFSRTLMATVQRAGIYKPNSKERERRVFRLALRMQLEQIAQGYKTKVSEEAHIKNILGLSTHLSAVNRGVLQNSRFRIGTAQKALNLHLKFLWCLGKVPEPPHCPFDSQIIAKLSAYKGPRWTILDTGEDYRNLITAAKAEARGASLAAWELETYNSA